MSQEPLEKLGRAKLAVGACLLLVGAVLLAITLWRLPFAALLAAWPILALAVAHLLLGALPSATLRMRGTFDASMPRSVGAWLEARLAEEPALGVTLAELDKPDGKNFYHPAARTIVLTPPVRDSNSAADCAIAARQLGHALAHAQSPRLAALAFKAAWLGARSFEVGVSVLLASALTGWTHVRIAAAALFAVSAAARAVAVVEEAAASSLAMKELRALRFDQGELGPFSLGAAQLRDARRSFTAGLALHAIPLLLCAAPFALWPQLTSAFDGALLTSGPPLSPFDAALATAASIAALVAGAACLALIVKPDLRLPLYTAACGAAVLPLFTVLLAPQALGPHALLGPHGPCALTFAIIPVATMIGGVLGSLLSTFLELPLRLLRLPTPKSNPYATRPRTISVDSLRGGETLNRLQSFLLLLVLLLTIPLASLHLFR